MASSNFIESSEQYSSLGENERKILDDYYWLRFLELDVPNEPSRGSLSKKKMDKMGQSMFTVTKRLRKEEEDKQFGFEQHIIWTKPSIINRIVKDSPADRSHLEPGDFIIFVDKVNVVDMKQSDMQNLIRDKEALTVEVFRRANVKMQIQNLEKSPIKSISITTNKTLSSIESASSNDVRRNKLVSKSSTDSKKRPLVTFSKDESIATSGSNESQRSSKLVGNLIQNERQFIENLNFGYNRYIVTLKNRKDLISSKEHEILFNNIENIKKLVEKIQTRDIPDNIVSAYKQNLSRFIEEYEKYFSVMKASDSVVVDKTYHPEFIKFIANPPIPSSQPLLHNFLHKPLEYYNELLKNLQMMLSQTRVDSIEYQDLNRMINSLQVTYCEAMDKAAERKVEAKPLLLNLESRLVFTKCKPFKLDMPGRQWIFGGDLVRIEGNLEKPTYALLFNDILLFSTINRDRVLFITEEPISLKAVVESFFNIRKRENEFRLTVELNPNYKDISPTTHCTPDLIMSPLRQSKRRNIFLRAPSEDIKNVWQKLITQQVFNVNSISPSVINHVEPFNINLLIKNPSTQTDIFSNVSTNKKETENVCSPYRRNNNNAHSNSNQLNLKSQNAFDMGDSLDKIMVADGDDDHLNTPETPSCANLSSLNEKIQKSFSSITFSSVKNIHSDCGESCEGIFNDFDSGEDYSNDVKECMFLQNDPFYADES